MAHNPAAAPHRFDVEMADLQGRRFRGHFISIAEKNPTNLKLTNRLLKVSSTTFLTPSTIVKAPDGNLYLLAESPSTLFGGVVTHTTFKAIHLDRQMVVKRSSELHDPVTRQMVKQAPTQIATIHAQMEPLDQKQDRSSRMTLFYERWALYTDYTLQVGDTLDDKYKVARVDELSGVTYAQVE